MDDRLERGWKWVLRALGVAGFMFLILKQPDAPIAFYVLLSGLLGLPNVIAYQMKINQSRRRGDDDEDPRR